MRPNQLIEDIIFGIFVFIIIVALLSIFIFYPARAQGYDNNCTQLDIVLVGDLSQSVEHQKGYLIEACYNFMRDLNVSDANIRLGIVTFTGGSVAHVILSGNKKIIKQGIQNINKVYSGGSTNMLSGLVTAKSMLDKNGRFHVKKIIILISDGAPNFPSHAPLNFGNLIKSEGIIICSIYLDSSEGNRKFMRNISSDCYKESNYKELSNTLNNLNFCL